MPRHIAKRRTKRDVEMHAKYLFTALARLPVRSTIADDDDEDCYGQGPRLATTAWAGIAAGEWIRLSSQLDRGVRLEPAAEFLMVGIGRT